MSFKFKPNYTITSKMAQSLLRIEVAREKASHLSVTPSTLASLRETARLLTTHYSTMIEGNRLDPKQVKEVLKYKGHFPGRERDESEVKGYFSALETVEQWAKNGEVLDETHIQKIHALVMAGGQARKKTSPYREGQNVIRNSQTGEIVYLPPEARDVPKLMKAFIEWIRSSHDLPGPLLAGIAHYQFATIHPYYDGNGRTARLLTTFLLHRHGYDLKGIYSIEEYYARQLQDYYEAISIGPSHNYYLGREEADITSWLEYFLKGLVFSFERVVDQMRLIESPDQTDEMMRNLESKKRKILELFTKCETITSEQVGKFFGFSQRSGTRLCHTWVKEGFLEVADASKRNRKYRLSREYENFVKTIKFK